MGADREVVGGALGGEADWVWWDDGGGDPWWNLALDEALFAEIGAGAVAGGAVAGLRLYGWDRPSVSIGRGFPLAGLAGLLDLAGRPVVRRVTGGGAVEHGADLTVSVFLPAGRLLGARAADVYGWVHRAIAGALEVGGVVGVEMSEGVPGAADLGRACFASPARDDVVVGGAKVAGGAIRRTRDGILYQGSIQGAAAGASGLGRAVARNLAPCGTEHREIPAGVVRAANGLARERYRSEAWLARC